MVVAMAAPKRRATYEDLMQVPDTKVAEIIDGELIVSPRPALPHAHCASAIGFALGSLHGPPGPPAAPAGWWILLEPELHFDDDVVVPDWAAWRRERMPVLPNAPFVSLAPDWVCEILSPSTGRIDRSGKMRVYARAGVEFAWLVDPILQTLEIYRLDGGRWAVVDVHGGDAVARVPPFEAVELRLGRWWVPDAST
jgi:Uma2 family endonuclease